MCLPKTLFYALWSIVAVSASIETQSRHFIQVDVNDVMTRDYTETIVGSEFLCAAITNAAYLYCYNTFRCITVFSSYGDIRGPTTAGWACKSGELTP